MIEISKKDGSYEVLFKGESVKKGKDLYIPNLDALQAFAGGLK